MNIIVTAAGAGQRFRDAGYNVPKPFIYIKEPRYSLSILEKTLLSFDFIKQADSLNFAFQTKDWDSDTLDCNGTKDTFDAMCYRHKYRAGVSLFPQLTRGNLETAYITALQTRPDPDEPLLILDSDNYFDGKDFLTAIKFWDSQHKDYALTCCFEPLDDSTKWGFVIRDMNDKSDRVVSILEKDPNALKLGGKPMMGVFYFSKASIFLKVAHDILYNPSPRDIKEFYMTESLTACLHKEIPVFALTVGNVIPLGTPEDLVAYQNTLKDKV